MKPFYLLVLLVGICMAVLMQVVDLALPRDALVATVLSKAPAGWELSLDDGLKARLVPYDVKSELVAALKKRASFRSQVYSQSFWEGAGLIVLAGIGLIRERRIGSMQKIIEQTAAANSGSAGAPPASVS